MQTFFIIGFGVMIALVIVGIAQWIGSIGNEVGEGLFGSESGKEKEK